MSGPLRWRIRIYQSAPHLLFTLFIIACPFVFLWVFSSVAHLTTSHLFLDLFISSVRLLIAFVISLVLAWFLAVGLSRGKASGFALPLFDVLQSFPTFAALPLATYLWGPSNLTVIVFLVLTVIWPMLFSIISSMHLIRHDWEEAVEISGLKGINYLRYFILPVTIPGLITGSIIGLGEGWEALVATEIIVQIKNGLGSFFQTYSTNLVITTFGIFGFLLFIFALNRVIWIPLLDWSHRRNED
ncbi:MAG: ABC transporter permease subunit [Patescibacteria group bacterium]|jgi:ABC-type nitrate/sulfonate/bicarbonate transport system permease component